MSTCTTPTARCRVRICNHVTGETVMVETVRDRADVLVDLMYLIRRTNRRRDESLRGCLCVRHDLIVLHWHSPLHYGDEFTRDMIEAVAPLHEVENILWKGGQQA